MSGTVNWFERHQVALYLAAFATGAVAGLLIPVIARPAQPVTTPVLGLLLYATFLSVPFINVRRGLRDWRFLCTVGVQNFVVVPVVVFARSRFLAHDQVLLTPCVDYAIAFTGLAGGAAKCAWRARTRHSVGSYGAAKYAREPGCAPRCVR